MELDTGAPCSIVKEKTLRSIKLNFTLCNTDRKFVSYMGHRISTLVISILSSTTCKLDLYVVKEQLDIFLGQEWIAEFANFNAVAIH